MLADSNDVSGTFVTATKMVFRFKGPILLGSVQVGLIGNMDLSGSELTRKDSWTYVTDARIHDLDQSLSWLQILGLDNIILFDLDVAIGLLDEGASGSFGDLLVGIRHSGRSGMDRYDELGVNGS